MPAMLTVAPVSFLGLAFALGATGAPVHEQWSRFRGPDGAGLAPSGARLPSALDPAKNRRWSTAVPAGHSSPCLWGERLFVTGAVERELHTLCLDARDGRILWKSSVTAAALERPHEQNGLASPTPTCDGERVVSYFGSFGLVCHDLAGKELWRRPLALPENTFGTASSPVLVEKRLYFVSDANDSSYLEAIDPAEGKTLWRKDRAGFVSGWSTPGLWTSAAGPELLVYGAFQLTAYDPADGRERWSIPGLADEPIVVPVTGAGLVFVSSYNMKNNPDVMPLWTFEEVLVKHDHDGSGTISKAECDENQSVLSRPDADGEGDHPLRIFWRFLDVDKSGEITEEEWKKLVAWVDSWTHANGLVAVRPGSAEHPAEIAWQYPRGVPECPSPLYYDGRIYTVMNGGTVTCLDAKSGALHYQGRLEARGPYYASPVAGDGKVYAASARGELSVFAAGDELKLLSTHALDERLMSTPALADGAVYVRTEEHVHAFGLPE